MPTRPQFRALRVYRILLRSFPPEFRQVYGGDLEAAFCDEMSAQGGGSVMGRIRFWLWTVADTVGQGVRERIARLSGRSPAPPPRRPLREALPWSAGGLVQMGVQELRYAVRSLSRRPGFSAAVVVILGAGLAGATVAWTAAEGVLLAPLGFAEEDRLVGVWQRSELPDGTIRPRFAVSDAQILALRDGAGSLEEVAWLNLATAAGTVLHRVAAPSVRVRYSRASTNFFSLLGVEAAHGRVFRPGDEERDVVLLSAAASSQYFGGAPDVVGRMVGLGTGRYEVVGVLPAGFRWLGFEDPVEFWLPQRLDPSRASPFFFNVVARLRPGATPTQAESEASTILLRVQDELVRPLEDPPRPYATVDPVREALLGDVGPQLEVMVGAVAFVLILAVANVSLLLLIRVAARGRDGALRAALGGGPGRVAAPVIAEATLLTACAWLLAMAGAVAALRALRGFAPSGIPRIETLGFSWGVLGTGAVLAAVAMLLLSALPVFLLRRVGILGLLSGSATPVGEGMVPRSLRAPLVVAEVALATILLSGAGLMVRSFAALQRADPGFETEGVLQGRVVLPVRPYWSELEGRGQPGDYATLEITPALAEVRRSLRERLAAHPGVAEVRLAKHTPLGGRYGAFTPFVREGREDEEMPPGEGWISSNAVEPGFLRFMGVELLRGRWLTEADDRGGRATALISEALARRFWPGEDPVGDRFRSGRLVADGNGGYRHEDVWVTVVGVVRSLREWQYRREDETVYRPLGQEYPAGGVVPRSARGPMLSVFVRYRGDPGPVAAHMRQTVARLLPGIPVDDLRTMDEVVGGWLREPRFYTGLLGAFGLLAMLLAAGGIAAVVGFGVSRRTREIGLRVALGAWPRHVVRLVTGETLLLVGLGVAAGVAGSLALDRTLEGLLFGVEAGDARNLITTALLFAAVAVVSAWIPARRALTVQPAEALRSE